MFNRIKKAIFRDSRVPAEASPSLLSQGPVSEWAATRGLSFSQSASGSTVSMQGKVAGRPWRLELGRPTRNYINGEELRARAELRVNDEISAMVINRPLKDVLERKAYNMLTDTLRTTADANLPEEMRWLAMFDEVGWEELPEPFWKRYAILTDRREHATAWMDESLAGLLMQWPEPAPGPEVPFLIVLLRGKCYLRMEYQPADLAVLEHASAIFTAACERAVVAFGR